MKDSSVEITPHAIVFDGLDAVNLYRAVTLRASLNLYAKSGIRISRGVTPTVMLAMAKEYTGKTYKGATKYSDAAKDVGVWIDTMKAALPISRTE